MNILKCEKMVCFAAFVLCCAVLTGCVSGKAKVQEDNSRTLDTAATEQVALDGFVTQSEFCKARMVHVAARLNILDFPKGTCYVNEAGLPAGVGQILKRTLKIHGLQIAQDQNSADYVLICRFDNQYIRRRTRTTINVTFAKNTSNNAVIWAGAATVTARGSLPVRAYSASLAGAVMYHFKQNLSSNVGKGALQSFYLSLSSVGE